MKTHKGLRIVCLIVFVTMLAALIGESSGIKSTQAAQPVPAPLAMLAQTDTTGLLSTSREAPEWMRGEHEWTAEEMAAAKPYPLPQLDSSPNRVSANEAFSQESLSAALTTAPFGYPEDEANPTYGTGLDFLSPGIVASPTGGYDYPGPFTRYTYPGKPTKEWPYKAIGKLFFYQNGSAYVCSASSIGGYAIWTAGHCVHDGMGYSSGWSYYMIFVPGYTYGKKQLGGVWKYSYSIAFTDWIDNGNLGLDMAGVVLYPLKGKAISRKVGWLGFAYGGSPEQHWFELGYPQASPFDGTKQVICASSYAYSDYNFSPAPTGVGCDQTGGTSGGPWIWSWGYGWYLNGNMSYRYVGYNQEIFSPYFGDASAALWSVIVTSYP